MRCRAPPAEHDARMSTALTTTDDSLPDKPKRFRIGPKLSKAIDAMVFEGKPMNEAAKIANTSTRAIRKALERSHVLAHIRKRREVLRASVSAETIHHAAKIMRKGRNEMAKLKAMSFIEQLGHDPANVQRQQAVGLVIVIGQPAPSEPAPVTIEGSVSD